MSDNTTATSPQADSGYELSVNTPASSRPWKYVQPGSSGYISGKQGESYSLLEQNKSHVLDKHNKIIINI